MAERFKAAVLKTVERKLRGFESLSLRQKKAEGREKRDVSFIIPVSEANRRLSSIVVLR
jgi:hypothetical protein